jgi:hypothetical protein
MGDMKSIIFLYRTKGVEPRSLTKMNAQLFGKEQQSNYGKYKYEVEGMIPKGEYIRPIRAVVIVKEQYSENIRKVFELYGIEYRSFKIELKEFDFKNRDFF